MRAVEGAISDWRGVKLASLSSFITKGTTPTTYGFKWELSGVLFLRSECVSDHGLDLTQSMFISPAAHAAFHRSQVLPDDLLVTITGNVGRVVIFEGADSANLNQHIARVRITDPRADSRFIYHWLSQDSVRRYFNGITTGQAYPQISLQQVRNAEVPLPPLDQQSAIAEALSDADALLGGLDRLIAKKRDLKQAAMQQLLTGQIRLPGFHGDWEETRLGEIGECIIGLTYDPKDVVEHGLLVLRSSNVQNGRLAFEDNVHVNLKVAEHLYTRAGDILVCVRNGSRALIGKSALIDEATAGMTFGAFMSVFRTRHWQFIAHAFQSSDIQRQIRDNIGATINQITSKDMNGFRVRLPPDDEQVAIATVLSDMDAELSALEARRDKTRALKQGMMQELLTGRIRLVSPENEESSAC